MKKKLIIIDREKKARQDRLYRMSLTLEQRLDLVEELRLEAGKFLFEYPTRLRRIVTVIRRPQR